MAGTDTAWIGAGTLAVLAAASTRAASGPPAQPPPRPATRVTLHRAALRPGLVFFLGLIGYSGYLAFAALHAADVGIANTDTVLAVFTAVAIVIRVFAAKLPDHLGPVMTSLISLRCRAAGLALLAVWQEPAGVYAGAAMLAVGQSFLFPPLFARVVDTAPDAERSHAISTLSIFFDLTFGLGGPVIGIVAGLADRGTGFLLAARIAVGGLLACGRGLGDTHPATSITKIGPRSSQR